MIIRRRSDARAGVGTTVLTVVTIGLTAGACSSSDPAAGDPSTTVAADDAERTTPEVGRRDFQIRLRLEGATTAGAAVPLATHPDLAVEIDVAPGSDVEQGATIGTTAVRPEVAASLGASSSPIEQDRLRSLDARAGTIVAPIGGVIGSDGSTIERSGVDVEVPLTPVQALRFLSVALDGTATVETTAGARSVDCAAVWLVWGDDAGPTARCRLPDYIETAPGLRGSVEFLSPVRSDVIVVPNRYIGYDRDSESYVITLDGDPTPVPVEVGPTDGVMRVVETDLPLGAALVAPSDP